MNFVSEEVLLVDGSKVCFVRGKSSMGYGWGTVFISELYKWLNENGLKMMSPDSAKRISKELITHATGKGRFTVVWEIKGLKPTHYIFSAYLQFGGDLEPDYILQVDEGVGDLYWDDSTEIFLATKSN